MAKAKTNEPVKKNKAIIAEAREIGSCAVCGCSNQESKRFRKGQLQFHHVDPSTKEFEISTAANRHISKTKLFKEFAKCELLCPVCHLSTHNNMDLPFKRKREARKALQAAAFKEMQKKEQGENRNRKARRVSASIKWKNEHICSEDKFLVNKALLIDYDRNHTQCPICGITESENDKLIFHYTGKCKIPRLGKLLPALAKHEFLEILSESERLCSNCKLYVANVKYEATERLLRKIKSEDEKKRYGISTYR